jgi:putative flippase GtrA
MLPEMLKFLVVGGLGTVIDLGGAALLHSKYHVEPLAAKAVSVTLATVFTYLGSRFWTFKERENQSVRREAVLFFVLNVVGLLIAEAVIGLVTYVMGLRGPLEYNAASFIGTGLGTIFRFYAYRKWVFLDPEAAAAVAPLPDSPAFPDYPPWELDPAFLIAEASVQAPLPAPTYSSPWERQPAATWDQAPRPSRLGAQAHQPAAFPPPGQVPPRPVPAPPKAPPAPPRSSGGGRHRKSLGGAGPARLRLPGRRVARQEHREHRRLAAGEHDPAAVGGRHRARERQAKSGALRAAADAALEDP